MSLTARQIRNRTSFNRCIKLFKVLWPLLLAAYIAWLAALGFEAARWHGAFIAILIGMGYPAAVIMAITIANSKPMSLDDK
jgi:hypothetical protein